MDQLAMNAAYGVDGSVVGVLADSLERKIRSADMRRAVLGGTTCLVTPYHPASGFSVGAAMNRNKVIYGLADGVLVVASALGSGGTWEGATEAIKRGYGKVLVWRGEGEDEGNGALEDMGATPVKSVDEMIAALSEPNVPVAVAEQLDLGLSG